MSKNHPEGIKVCITARNGAKLDYLRGFYGARHNFFSTEYSYSVTLTIEMLVWNLEDYNRVKDRLGSDLLQITITPNAKID